MNRRTLIAVAASALVLVPLGYFCISSLEPDTYSVMEMGEPVYGGGSTPAHLHHGGTPVTDLVADPDRKADVHVELEAAQQGDRFTLNGSTPGPTIRATVGDLIEVELTNTNIAEGTTLHWHGVDLPNAEDGVAGVTQDAVAPGESHTYRFVADDAGTYWYHSHQVSHEQVARGLFGALVIEPQGGDGTPDVVVMSHVYNGVQTINGATKDVRADVGDRIRIINTDNGTLDVWSSAAFQVVAVDGRDLFAPGTVENKKVRVAAGGRIDVVVGGDGARVQIGGPTSIVMGDAPHASDAPSGELDLMSYGTPFAQLPFDPTAPDRTFDYVIGQRPGFLDGRPGVWWTVNKKMGMDVPMFVVEEGDVVRFRISNDSGDAHPMHLHGHHALVTEFNGKKATGSPWWADSLDLAPGDTAEIVFLADNPGIWMDHCHNLPHAKDGLIAHLMYAGVTTPFLLGGTADNEPE